MGFQAFSIIFSQAIVGLVPSIIVEVTKQRGSQGVIVEILLIEVVCDKVVIAFSVFVHPLLHNQFVPS